MEKVTTVTLSKLTEKKKKKKERTSLSSGNVKRVKCLFLVGYTFGIKMVELSNSIQNSLL